MKKASSIIIMLLCSYIFIFTGNALAIPLNGEYSINVFTQQIDEDSWYFKYDITNNNQQIGNEKTGLDGFFVLLPDTAVITDMTVPNSYHGSDGYWTWSINEDNWITWWGNNPSSTYPVGSTASFSFIAHNVTLGEASSQLTTFWSTYEPESPYITFENGGNYTSYQVTLDAPAATTPEPGTVALLGVGLCCLGIWARKSTRKV